MDSFGIPKPFTSTVRSLYQNAQTIVMINGVKSELYLVTRGVRQGDPLFCPLFDIVLRFYPHFSTFLTHVTSRAFSLPRHLPRAPSMCLQITGFIFAYIALTCIILFALLFGSLQLCRGFLLRSYDLFVSDSLVPLSTTQLSHLICFLIPTYILDILQFTFIRGLMLLSSI